MWQHLIACIKFNVSLISIYHKIVYIFSFVSALQCPEVYTNDEKTRQGMLFVFSSSYIVVTLVVFLFSISCNVGWKSCAMFLLSPDDICLLMCVLLWTEYKHVVVVVVGTNSCFLLTSDCNNGIPWCYKWSDVKKSVEKILHDYHVGIHGIVAYHIQ